MSIPAGSGYDFALPGIANTNFSIFWDGTHITAGDNARFADSAPGATPDQPGDPQSASFDRTEVTPQAGGFVYLKVHGPTEDRVYSLWIPPGQTFAANQSLTFDWKLASVKLLTVADGPLPRLLDDINLPGDFFKGGADVATTNLLLTLTVVLLLLAGGSVFNEALQDTLADWSIRSVRIPGGIASPLRWIHSFVAATSAGWAAVIPGRTWVDRALAPAALLLGTGFIYTLLDPNFGFNETTLTLFISLVISQGVLALAYEGGKAWLYRRRLRVAASVRLFPACIGIAIASVLISRLADFHPGIVVGFIAAAVILEKESFAPSERGRASAYIAATIFAVSVGSWLLAIPLHRLYESSPSVWTAIPEATAVSIFVVCLEGLLFSLMPLQFMDGWRIWKWSPLAWFALFVPTAFMFAQILFNAEQSYFDFISSHRSVGGMAIIAFYLAATWGTWAYLRRRAEKDDEEARDRASEKAS